MHAPRLYADELRCASRSARLALPRAARRGAARPAPPPSPFAIPPHAPAQASRQRPCRSSAHTVHQHNYSTARSPQPNPACFSPSTLSFSTSLSAYRSALIFRIASRRVSPFTGATAALAPLLLHFRRCHRCRCTPALFRSEISATVASTCASAPGDPLPSIYADTQSFTTPLSVSGIVSLPHGLFCTALPSG